MTSWAKQASRLAAFAAGTCTHTSVLRDGTGEGRKGFGGRGMGGGGWAGLGVGGWA